MRRQLIRGGTIAAGIAAAGAVLGAPTAEAADGDEVRQGADNSSGGGTTLSVNGATGGSEPALRLRNTTGPALQIDVVDDTWDGDLGLGQIINTSFGPVVGVRPDPAATEVTSTNLVTALDIQSLPITSTVDPVRLLDTRSRTSRAAVVDSSTAQPFDASGRLRTRCWVDVEIDTQGYFCQAAFVNLAALAPTRNGYQVVYTPGERPGTSTINFRRGASVANAAIVLPSYHGASKRYRLRVWVSAATHVLLDLNGGVFSRGSIPWLQQSPAARVREAFAQGYPK